MMKCLTLFLTVLFSQLTLANSLPPRDIGFDTAKVPDDLPLNILSFTYSPAAKVTGDLPDEDGIDRGDYTEYTLDTGTAKALKWTYLSPTPVYIEYTTIDTKRDGSGSGVDKFQTLSLGLGIGGISKVNTYFDFYGGLFAGIGGSRFDLEQVKHQAHAEASGELGFLMAKFASLGIGVKYQIVGYPSETMAEAWYGNLSLGLWF